VAITDYHSMILAHHLSNRSASADVDKLASTISGAKVDLNPHQINAALFAFQNPLSQGVLLADEVGLGKTIEAGLVIAQLWAERERTILVITPATLRKQWLSELEEKFFLDCEILESASYNQKKRDGILNPFDSNNIVICSYQFANSKADDLRRIEWGLVVMDEAHFLRNVYKSSGSRIAKGIKQALVGRRKLLLTATPLQNSLNELFGLVSMIDENVFGDLNSFTSQYARLSRDDAFDELKDRLRPIAHRTLRRQVTAYVRYTDRHPILQPYDPSDDEMRLYDLVSEYLRRDNLYALPPSQRTLMTLVLRKLLASSTYAIAGTLESIANRLTSEGGPSGSTATDLQAEFESLVDSLEESNTLESERIPGDLASHQQAIEEEIRDLRSFVELARSIPVNAKGQALLTALDTAFRKAQEFGAPRKALIFTESRRTQQYLVDLLKGTDAFANGIVVFNGSNNDPISKNIYERWKTKHRGTDVVTGAGSADMRSALVDYFREEGQIMIATEAAAQGLNLQFCSLIINYDLPWNPQRIEQRIGRCHRYGQKHDVVVVNFLNKRNQADERVYELLDEKFHLFKGVFGASDEVLGSITSGYDIEREINRIYQEYRREEEIDAAFAQLRLKLDEEIQAQMADTRKRLLENFDDDVTERLSGVEADTRVAQSRTDRALMRLTLHELGDCARALDETSFILWASPYPELGIRPGKYELPRPSSLPEHYYRLGHPLSNALIRNARSRRLEPTTVIFDYAQYEGRITAIERLRGMSGWMSASLLQMNGTRIKEDHLIMSALTDSGDAVDSSDALRFFNLPGFVHANAEMGVVPLEALEAQEAIVRSMVIDQSLTRNAEYLEDEAEKLDQWALDRRRSIDNSILEIDAQILEVKKQIRQNGSVSDRLEARRRVNQLEADKDLKMNERIEQMREITRRRDEIYDELEAMLRQDSMVESLFTIRWHIA